MITIVQHGMLLVLFLCVLFRKRFCPTSRPTPLYAHVLLWYLRSYPCYCYILVCRRSSRPRGRGARETTQLRRRKPSQLSHQPHKRDGHKAVGESSPQLGAEKRAHKPSIFTIGGNSDSEEDDAACPLATATAAADVDEEEDDIVGPMISRGTVEQRLPRSNTWSGGAATSMRRHFMENFDKRAYAEQQHSKHFVELGEVSVGRDTTSPEWHETARWLKYEEDVTEDQGWSKPHVATLSVHSVLELRA